MSGDLPTPITRVTSGALASLVEAVGPGPSSEYHVSTVDLYSVDAHSGTSTGSYLLKNSDDSTPYSCERWVRIRFSPPYGTISNIRFWVDNYAPIAGWEINWGTALTYNTPRVGSRSQIAMSPLPQTDPGGSNIAINDRETLAVGFGSTIFTDWIVLQAAWKGAVYGAIQPAPLNLTFAWRER